MRNGQLPTKLNKNVLLDVIFELRFSAKTGFSDLLPGSAKDLFGKIEKIEKTPLSEIPVQIREADPNLLYQPTIRMQWKDTVLLVGDRSIGLGYGTQYPGWARFKSDIQQVLGCLSSIEMIEKIGRYSIKYVDFIPFSISQGLETPYLVHVQLNDIEVRNSPIKVQVEKQEDFGSVLFDFAHPVQIRQGNGPVETGSLISVDSVCHFKTGSTWDGFINNFERNIDSLHQINKEYFFGCLSEEILEKLEPDYE
ncbi:MAG: TIGR04255 family protein [Pusillimonas sp.]